MSLLCVLCRLDPDPAHEKDAVTTVNGHAACDQHLPLLASVNRQGYVIEALHRYGQAHRDR